MASSATFAFGSAFAIGATTVSELTNITPPNMGADTIEVTSHSSTDNYREFIQGLRDGGEISIEGVATTATIQTLYTQLNTSGTTVSTITLPTSPSVTKFTASVIVTSIEIEASHDDAIRFTAGLKITGKPILSFV